MATKAEVIEEIRKLAAAYPMAVLVKETYTAFAEDLEEYDVDTVRLAVRHVRRESKFFPTISEVRKMCEYYKPTYPPEHICDGCRMCDPDSFRYEMAVDGFARYDIDITKFEGSEDEKIAAGHKAFEEKYKYR